MFFQFQSSFSLDMYTKINHLLCLKVLQQLLLDGRTVPTDIQLHNTASPEHDLLISSSIAFVTHLLLTEYHKDVVARSNIKHSFEDFVAADNVP